MTYAFYFMCAFVFYVLPLINYLFFLAMDCSDGLDNAFALTLKRHMLLMILISYAYNY